MADLREGRPLVPYYDNQLEAVTEEIAGVNYLRVTGGGGGGGDATAANQLTQISIETQINEGNGTTTFGINGAQGTNFNLSRLRTETQANFNNSHKTSGSLGQFFALDSMKMVAIPVDTTTIFTSGVGDVSIYAILDQSTLTPIPLSTAFTLGISGLSNIEKVWIQQNAAKGAVDPYRMDVGTYRTSSPAKNSLVPPNTDIVIVYFTSTSS